MKKTQVKFLIYFLIVVALGVSSYYYYNYLEKSTAELTTAISDTPAPRRLSSRNLETGVLESQKFKDLQKINVEEAYLDENGQATTTPSNVDVARVPRRHANPFKPF